MSSVCFRLYLLDLKNISMFWYIKCLNQRGCTPLSSSYFYTTVHLVSFHCFILRCAHLLRIFVLITLQMFPLLYLLLLCCWTTSQVILNCLNISRTMSTVPQYSFSFIFFQSFILLKNWSNPEKLGFDEGYKMQCYSKIITTRVSN